MRHPRIDLLPLAAAVLALAVAGMYLLLIRLEGGQPTWWAVIVLVCSAAGAAYATWRRAPLRRLVLALCAAALAAPGYVALLTVGPPILLAAGLCVAAVLRAPARDWRDSV